MPQRPRQESASSIYHVVTRGNSHQIIFESDEDRAFFMTRLAAFLQDTDGKMLAWCLMDNHVHLLLHIPHPELSRLMGTLLSCYARYFNRVHGRCGPLFDGRFRSEPVETESHLLCAVRYIHMNPFKAGLSRTLAYRWSSYNEYAGVRGRRVRGWSDTAFVLDAFGGLEAFLSFHENWKAQDNCLDVELPAEGQPCDSEARSIIEEICGSDNLHIVQMQPKSVRNNLLAEMKAHGLTTRQIQRLTGVSLGVIARAKKRNAPPRSVPKVASG